MPRFGDDDLLLNEEDDDETLDGFDESEAEDRDDSGAFADIDQLLARTRRSLAAYNDLGSEEGRRRLRLDDPAFGGEGTLNEPSQVTLSNCREACASAQ